MRDRLAFAAFVLLATGAAGAGVWRVAVKRTAEAHAWQAADGDHDGLPLRADLDPDGDQLDVLSDSDADGDGRPNAEDVASAALDLTGELTDPLRGQYGNLLGRAGFRVCIDLGVEAWLRAGLSASALLLSAAKTRPDSFAIDANNSPADPNFVRRVRNYRALFASEPGLALNDRPRLGAWAFYGEDHVGVVTAVAGAGYTVTEAYGVSIASRAGAEIEARTGERATFGWIMGRSP